MSFNPIIIIAGEPQSTFIEIFIKAIIKLKKSKKPIILISSKEILKKNLIKFKKKLEVNNLKKDFSNIRKKKINLINVDYKGFSFAKKQITSKSNLYINNSFKEALKFLKKKKNVLA